ncbi:hypothetical protein PLESTF_000693600 [Pleodorina starrii]|nr:hypothetical protein PLESTF_000693600 [Pleodorina starrii]
MSADVASGAAAAAAEEAPQHSAGREATGAASAAPESAAAAAAAAAAAPTRRKYKWLVEVEPAVPGDPSLQRPSLSPVFRHVWSTDGWPAAPHGATTCWDLWRSGVERNGAAPCLGWRRLTADGKPGPYTFITYDEAEQQARPAVCQLSAGLAASGLVAGDKVAVFATNSPEWMIVLQACNRMNYVCVPVYDTLGRDAVQFIVNHSGATVLFVASEKMQAATAALPHVTVPLRLLVHWGPRPMGHMEGGSAAAASGAPGAPFGGRGDEGGGGGGGGSSVRHMTFADLMEGGARAGPVPPQPPRPSDLTTLMYTSGTTGDPKGVQLTHSAVVAAVASLAGALQHYNEWVGPGDSMLSYLPLAHIFDRVSEETCIAAGASIGYWSGDVARVADDAAALKPSVFIGVPRVYDRVFETVQHRLSRVNRLRRSIFGAMYDRKRDAMSRGAPPDSPTLRLPPLLGLGGLVGRLLHRNQHQPGQQTPGQAAAGSEEEPVAGGGFGAAHGWGLGLGFVDSIVFGRIRRGLGGRLRLVVSGGAPLSRRVEEFLRVTLGCPVGQGYGLTESCAASFMQEPYTWEQTGSVGPPLPCTEFRLRSVPEMGYLAEGGGEGCDLPAGELLLRGPQMFNGYYRRPDLTREAMVPDPGFPLPPEDLPAATATEAAAATVGIDPRVGRWFCTGDIAALRPDGCVEIVDRIKSMFKLSQGEYISPERLEGVYGECNLMEQIWVYGDSKKSALVAVVVPHLSKLLPLAGHVEIQPPTGAAAAAAAAAPAGPEATPEAEAEAEAPPLLRQRREGPGGGGGGGDASPEEMQDARRLAAAAGVPVAAGPEAGAFDAVSGGGGGGGSGGSGKAPPTMRGSLCRSPRVVAAVLQKLQEVGRASHLRGFEIVRAVHLVPEPFTPDNGLLTPTLKLRRPALLRRFRREVDEMYEQLAAAAPQTQQQRK